MVRPRRPPQKQQHAGSHPTRCALSPARFSSPSRLRDARGAHCPIPRPQAPQASPSDDGGGGGERERSRAVAAVPRLLVGWPFVVCRSPCGLQRLAPTHTPVASPDARPNWTRRPGRRGFAMRGTTTARRLNDAWSGHPRHERRAAAGPRFFVVPELLRRGAEEGRPLPLVPPF